MKYIIIGGSAAAISAIEAIRSIDATSKIDLFSDESTPLFSRVLLPYYVAEELSKQLLNFRPLTFFEDNNVNAHMGTRIVDVSADSKTVKTAEGVSYEFDRLLMATGGNAIVPPIPGIEMEGVSTLKTMEDAERVYSMKGKKAVVIGAGSIGVESCISLKRRGMEVTLIEQLGRVLPTVFDDEASGIIQRRMEGLGIRVLTGERANKFIGNGHVAGVVADSGEIPCDMVVLAIGVKPSVELATKAGAEVGELGGIKVDDRMMTTTHNIYAAGDVAETRDIASGSMAVNAIWPCAMEQGKVAGLNMAGESTVYPGSLRTNSIGNFIGQPAISIGMVNAPVEVAGAEAGESYQEIKRRSKDTYRKLVLKGDRIVGAILVGDTQKAGIMTLLIKKKIPLGEFVPVIMGSRLNFMDILPLMRRYGEKFSELEFKELMDTGI